MRYQLRIIAGELKGRKVTVAASPKLRPLTDRVRESLFNILGELVVGRPFIDVFAGSGAVGIEALSRGASSAVLVERDAHAAKDLTRHLLAFGVANRAKVLCADAYRWADKGDLSDEPIVIFIGPPYEEFERHLDAVLWLVTALQRRAAAGSIIVLQSESGYETSQLPQADQWVFRSYGRTQLAFWGVHRNPA